MVEEEKSFVPTNIEGLDEVLGGGLPSGSCILLLAPPVVETHLFCLEFVYRGLVNDEPGLIVTMNYSPEELKMKALKYGWVLVQGEQKGILRWVDGYSYNANKDDDSKGSCIGGCRVEYGPRAGRGYRLRDNLKRKHDTQHLRVTFTVEIGTDECG